MIVSKSAYKLISFYPIQDRGGVKNRHWMKLLSKRKILTGAPETSTNLNSQNALSEIWQISRRKIQIKFS
jgi:hypothetical protein